MMLNSNSSRSNVEYVVARLNAEFARHHIDFHIEYSGSSSHHEDNMSDPGAARYTIKDNRFCVLECTDVQSLCLNAIRSAIVFVSKCNDRFHEFSKETEQAILESNDVRGMADDFLKTDALEWSRLWGFDCMSKIYPVEMSCINIPGYPCIRSENFNILLLRNDSPKHMAAMLNDQLFHRLDGYGLAVSLSQSSASSASKLSSDETEDRNHVLYRQILSHFMDLAEERFSKADDPSLGWDPIACLINIWMSNDASLETRWSKLLGVHAERLSAHAFYQWHLFSEMHGQEGDIDLGRISQPLFSLANYGVSLDQLNRLLPALSGKHHENAINENAVCMGRSGWNIYLSSLGALYGSDDTLFVFQQWKGLCDHGVSSIAEDPCTFYLRYAQLALLPDSAWRRNNHQLSYEYMASQYEGVDLQRMEATLALSGNLPPPNHPHHAALLACFYYSPTLIPGSQWPHDDARKAVLYVEHPIHKWFKMNASLGRSPDFSEWLDFYISIINNDRTLDGVDIFYSNSNGV